MSEYLPCADEKPCLEFDGTPEDPRQDAASIDLWVDPAGNVTHNTPRLETRGTNPQSLERRPPKPQPTELWRDATLHRLSVVAKLRSIGRSDLADPLAACHTQETCRVCTGCRRVTVFFNRCERNHCPSCQPRLARDRRLSVEWWTKELQQPKHVVLTMRNTETLTKAHVLWFKAQFTRLRHRKITRNWHAGFYGIEVTNERRGWHLHLHALVDAAWIPKDRLSKEWGQLLGQAFAIVDVKDVAGKDYLRELTKYSVKGSQLAGWNPAEIATFIDAFQGVRTFGVFGSLYGLRTKFAEWINLLHAKGHTCPCGCATFRILSPNELAWEQIRRESERAGIPANGPPVTPDLPLLPPVDSVAPDALLHGL